MDLAIEVGPLGAGLPRQSDVELGLAVWIEGALLAEMLGLTLSALLTFR